MINGYPVAEVYKRTLNYIPSKSECLLKKDVDTIRNLHDVIAFIWLTNGRGYWYHIKNVQNGTLYGYVLAGNRWNYAPVQFNAVLRYY
jgi:hypothetical protein